MQFQLDKDLCFLDLETTGGDIMKDRIVQIALIKYPKDGGAAIERSYLVNPGQPSSAEALGIHGLGEQELKGAPPFKLLAIELLDFIGDADLAGYNSNRFDIPVLMEEFSRAGFEFSIEGRRLIDAMQIFYKMEPRTLKAALRFYCGQNLENAHDALADTRATAEVLKGQIERYAESNWQDPKTEKIYEQPVKNDMQALHDFIQQANRKVDLGGRFVRNAEGVILFNFGNQKGQPAYKHPNTLRWIIDKEFPVQVKNIARAILGGKLK